VFDCDGEPNRLKTTALLLDYDVDVAASLAYFEEHGGYCDCEVVFNVEP
jgi:uridine phosphorylase